MALKPRGKGGMARALSGGVAIHNHGIGMGSEPIAPAVSPQELVLREEADRGRQAVKHRIEGAKVATDGYASISIPVEHDPDPEPYRREFDWSILWIIVGFAVLSALAGRGLRYVIAGE